MIYDSFNLDKELTKVNPIKVLCSGLFTKEDVGKTVLLSNGNTSCQEWIIADVDHDNTTGTVDLFSKYSLTNMARSGKDRGDYTDIPYDSNILDAWLNKNLFYGFTDEVQMAMDMVDRYRYAIVPSLYELGLQFTIKNSTGYVYMSKQGKSGSLYPLFTPGVDAGTVTNIYNACNTKTIFKESDGSLINYWTRDDSSLDGNDRNKGICITGSGRCGLADHTYNAAKVIARIRFNSFNYSNNIKMLNGLKTNPVKVLTSGNLTKNFIGLKVTLNNSATDCKEWIIADVNHDDTIGTVDLVPSTVLADTTAEKCDSFLNDTIYNGFDSDVKKALTNMDLKVVSGSYKRYVGMLSMEEFCYNYSFYNSSSNSYQYGYASGEGSKYPLFGPNPDIWGDSESYRNYKINFSSTQVMTRSSAPKESKYAACVYSGMGSHIIRASSTAVKAFGKIRFSMPNEFDIGRIVNGSIGDIVALPNSAADCQQWIVAGINMDGATETVDLVPRRSLGTCKNVTEAYNYLNTTLIDGFDSTIKGLIVDQTYEESSECVISRLNTKLPSTKNTSKVKLPAIHELGLSYSGEWLGSTGVQMDGSHTYFNRGYNNNLLCDKYPVYDEISTSLLSSANESLPYFVRDRGYTFATGSGCPDNGTTPALGDKWLYVSGTKVMPISEAKTYGIIGIIRLKVK